MVKDMLYNITLKKGFYFSAGKKFGWGDSAGIGIRVDALTPDNDIMVKSNYGVYHINGGKGLSLVNKYNSGMTVGNGTRIGIIPVNEFDKCD